MIRNLKKLGDDEKQMMTLKEQLQLAIKNDEAISAMRANAQKNIPLELSREDQRTLSEQIADEDSQRVQAQQHLSQLFKAPEVLAIISLLNKDQIVGVNTLWNGIKDELKGVNTKLMHPKDFALFLNKYMDTAVSLEGALTVGINSVGEMEKLIPDEQTISDLMDFLSSRAKTSTLQQQVVELAKVLPSDVDYNTIELTPAIEQKDLIDEGISLYPNKILLEKALAEGNLGKVEKLLQSNTPANRNKIQLYLERIKALEDEYNPPPIGPARPRVVSPKKSKRSAKLPLPADDDDATAVTDFEAEITDANTRFLNSLKTSHKVAVVKRWRDPNAALTKNQAASYEAFVRNNIKAVEEGLDKLTKKDRRAVENALGASGWAVASPDTYEFVGKGIKLGRGRPPSDKPKAPHKMKIGEGIKVYKRPVNIEFGKYVLNTNKLDKQILHLKGRAGGALSWFQPVPISDAFTELLNDMISTNTVNKHLLKSLDKDEQRTFYEVCDKSGLLSHFKLEKPEDTTEKDLMNKFQILLGEFKAGSNSPLLFQQLRKHIIYFTERGRIPKQKALAMLTELS